MVLWAQQSLRDTPAERWANYKKAHPHKSHTWEGFKTYLIDLLGDRKNRDLNTSARYHDAKQGEKQTVQEFVAYLESLEADMEPQQPRTLCTNLLHKLKPDIRGKIIGQAIIPETREELVNLAARLEGAVRTPSRGPRDNKSERGYGRLRGNFTNRRRDGVKPEKTSGDQKVEEGSAARHQSGAGTTTDRRACYKCGDPSHIAKFCPGKGSDKANVSAVSRVNRLPAAQASRKPESESESESGSEDSGKGQDPRQ